MESLESSLAQYLNRICFRQEHRRSGYHGRWTWAIAWNQAEVSALRNGLDAPSVQHVMNIRRQWRRQHGGFWHSTEITDQVQDRVLRLAAWLDDPALDYKLVLYSDRIMIYTNEQATVENLVRFVAQLTMSQIEIKQAQITVPADVIMMQREHDYQYRTYLRSKKLDGPVRTALLNWLTDKQSQVQASGSLLDFLRGTRRTRWYRNDRTWEYHFIDHNDPKLELWICMFCPDLVRKTMSIQSGAK